MSEEKTTRGGNFLRNFASKFVEIQDDEPRQESSQITIPISVMPDGNSSEQSEAINEELFAKLGKVIEESNIPGPDYVELVTLANGKDEQTGEFVMAGDEAARYSTAFRAIKLMNPNFTKEIVLNSIDEYIRILEAERTNAIGELQDIWNRDVAMPEAELKKTEDEIAQLQKRLNELTAFAAQKRESVEKAKIDSQSKRSSFENTFKVVKGRLVEDKQKLTNIL